MFLHHSSWRRAIEGGLQKRRHRWCPIYRSSLCPRSVPLGLHPEPGTQSVCLLISVLSTQLRYPSCCPIPRRLPAMKTLALLAVLFYLAVQAQSEPVRAPFKEAVAQEQVEEGDQVPAISISMFEDESSALQDSGVKAGRNCYCRRGPCQGGERTLGTCIYRNIVFRFCC
ncbi:neutrophil antibiotic peptide NP-1-like [Thomomys bottae]